MRVRVVAVTSALIVLAISHVWTQAPPRGQHWVTTWGTALVSRPSQAPEPSPPREPNQAAPQAPPRFTNQTLRQIVHTSIGGEQIRVVFSNTFGTAPLNIGAASVGRRETGSALVAGSSQMLTFGGRPMASIAPGAVVVSDTVAFRVSAQSDLAVDLYLPEDTAAMASPLTLHAAALQTNYISDAGNHARETMLPVTSMMTSWFFLARVEVLSDPEVGAVVALGDSITDGARSAPDANGRWPDYLARAMTQGGIRMGMVNMGIAGNRLLADNNSPSALARLDRDVLVQPGVTHVIVMEGINDLGRGVPAADVIAAQKQILERARARGLTVIGATITPVEDTTQQGYYTPTNEAARLEVNQWIRTSRSYDAVVDFDALLRDPKRPTKLQVPLASNDFIHPNDAGYRAMGMAVDLALFKARAGLTVAR